VDSGNAADRADGGHRVADLHSVEFVFREPRFKIAAGPALIAHIIRNAAKFVRIYNDSLQKYRDERHIAGKQHPIPDLVIDAVRVELPFWVMRQDAPRQRFFVSPSPGGGIELQAGHETIGQINEAICCAMPVGGALQRSE